MKSLLDTITGKHEGTKKDKQKKKDKKLKDKKDKETKNKKDKKLKDAKNQTEDDKPKYNKVSVITELTLKKHKKNGKTSQTVNGASLKFDWNKVNDS